LLQEALMRYAGLAALTLGAISVGIAQAAVLVDENFEDDTPAYNGGGWPTAHPSTLGTGTWLAGSNLGLYNSSYTTPLAGSVSGEYYNSTYDATRFSDPTPGLNHEGYLAATSAVTAPGTAVHAEFKFRWLDGFSSFGLSTNLFPSTTAGQNANALILLRHQDRTGSLPLGLNAIDSSGTAQSLGINLGSAQHLIAIDYLVGNATATVMIDNGSPITNVPLRNPGGSVTGLFFTDWDPATASTGGFQNLTVTNYRVDDILLTAVPEPGTAALLLIGGASMMVSRRRK